jgi:hypothetical protein
VKPSIREREWFFVAGRVAGAKAEVDGDLHSELRDADKPHGVRVVVEVPLDRHGGKTPWNGIRETVFGWSDQKSPFDTRTVTSFISDGLIDPFLYLVWRA